MENRTGPWTLGQLAEMFRAELNGPADLLIARPVEAGSDDPQGITFAENDKYLAQVEASNVGAVILARGVGETSKPCLRVDVPRIAFVGLLMLADRPIPIGNGTHPTASISPEAEVDPSAQIGPYAVIERGAKVGAGARIHAFVYVGEDCEVGPRCVLAPHVVLLRDVSLGEGTTLLPGCVLGADGFGYIWDGAKRQKIHQVGRVEVGANCEIGANTTIDRSTCGMTQLGDGVKIDNLVMIAHNCEIGDHTAIAGLTGIAGSTKIGKRVVIGGSAGIKDHAVIVDDVGLGARSGVMQDLLEPGEYFGVPAIPVRDALKQMALVRRLPKLLERIEALEAEVTRLKKEAT